MKLKTKRYNQGANCIITQIATYKLSSLFFSVLEQHMLNQVLVNKKSYNFSKCSDNVLAGSKFLEMSSGHMIFICRKEAVNF